MYMRADKIQKSNVVLEAKKPKVSVIIPIYNVEEYLPQCLNSVINQTFQDIEVICINDGSTDGSGQILEQYASQDSRIKVINQENLGVSVARNVGIDTATGEYLSFIDGDDWLDIEAYQNLVACLTPQTDILFFNNRCACVDGSLHKNNKKIDISKVADFEYRIQKLCSGVTNSIVRKSLIEKYGVRFSKSVCFGEDGLFMMELMLHNPYVSFNDGCYYNYRFARPNSTSTSGDVYKELAVKRYVDKQDYYLQADLKTRCLIDLKICGNIVYRYNLGSSQQQKENIKYLRQYLAYLQNTYASSDISSNANYRKLKEVVSQADKKWQFSLKFLFSIRNSTCKQYKIITILGNQFYVKRRKKK